ncbi:MAG: hypothetical protein ACP5H2_05920 [Solirubrobacteraceae bacterium]
MAPTIPALETPQSAPPARLPRNTLGINHICKPLGTRRESRPANKRREQSLKFKDGVTATDDEAGTQDEKVAA